MAASAAEAAKEEMAADSAEAAKAAKGEMAP